MGVHSAPTNSRFKRMTVSTLLAGGAVLAGAGAASAQPVEFDVPGGVAGLPDTVSFDVPEDTAVPEGYTDVAGDDVSDFIDGLSDQINDTAGAPSSTGQAALSAAETKIGSPYVWGAAGPDSFDCSGLTSWAYQQAGVDIPRTSEQQAAAGTPVSIDDLQPGDLVTFYSGASHVGIYAGDGQVLHAPTSGSTVSYAPLDSMPINNAVRF